MVPELFVHHRASHVLKIALTVLLFFGVVAHASPPGSKLIVQPESIDLAGPEAQHGVLVTLVEPGGRTIDVTHQCRFTSDSPKVVDAAADAQCRAIADGHATVTARYDGLSAPVSVTVSDTGKFTLPSFRQDVVPILTKAGCNAGSCHGKLIGQNGFRLSLRGYAPEMDYDSLTSEFASRRIDFAEPEKSLLLRKPLGQIPHEGGRRFSEDSRAARVLLEWIKGRAPGPDPTEADAASLEVLPANRVMHIGDTQQLLVRAHWPDGSVRDVTWSAQLFSNDASVASVSETGVVKSLRNGETSIRVHFQGLVEIATFTTPFDQTVDPQQFAEKYNEIDEHVFARLQTLHIPPAPLCDDATYIRRAFVDTIGLLPTPAEIRSFLADSRSDKRAKLVDTLLQRPEYADYWALQMSDLLQNRRERDHDSRGAKGTRAMHEWLRQQMAANRPWDALARDVLTATGDAVHSPQIGYFIVLMGEKQNVEESDVTDSIAQAFLGSRLGCARCHNHPLEKYTQDDYYHFAAFFSRTTLRRAEMGKGTPALLSINRDGFNMLRQIDDSGKKVAEAEDELLSAKGADEAKAQTKLEAAVKREQDLYTDLERAKNRPAQVNQPRTGKPMNAQPLDRSTAEIEPGQDARVALAAWITDPKNDQFSGAMANRLWKHFMGVGLVEPVDDIRSSNPPSNPALFHALSAYFVSRGYDFKQMMRLILNSRTYQLSSDTNAENQQDHHYFSHFYARRMEAEVMSDAISSATGVPDTFPGYPIGLRAVQLPEPYISSYFLSMFGRSERITACACERNGEVTLPQLLHLNNGDDVLDRVRSVDGRLAKILNELKDDTAATEEVFLATFGRLPTSAEREAVSKALGAGDPREDVYHDLMWALLNSKEFAFNH